MIPGMVSRPDSGTGPALAVPAGRRRPEESPGSVEPSLDGAFSSDGVDLTVIRWMLERSPEERLRAAQELVDAAWALRGDEA